MFESLKQLKKTLKQFKKDFKNLKNEITEPIAKSDFFIQLRSRIENLNATVGTLSTKTKQLKSEIKSSTEYIKISKLATAINREKDDDVAGIAKALYDWASLHS